MIDFDDRSQSASSGTIESFREFVAKRKSGDNPVGDFVKDVRRDKCFPAAAQTWQEVEHHMCARPHWACDEAVAVGKRLWNKYARENALNPAGWPPLPKNPMYRRASISFREHLPYGKWTCADGREVLFNRNGQPIWQQYPGQIAGKADKEEWIRHISVEHYYDPMTIAIDKKTIDKLFVVLEKFGVDNPFVKVRGKAVLYRHFDEDEVLLYVGQSIRVLARQADHEETAPWFDEVARIEIERFPTLTAALAAEKLAIKTEHPRYNITHNNKP